LGSASADTDIEIEFEEGEAMEIRSPGNGRLSLFFQR
jgi:hypothetical protein